MRDYRKLRVFDLADRLAHLVYDLTADFPRRELFALSQQMRKSAVSVAANIVEGSARETEPDFRRFLSISQGSLHELGYYIRFALRQNLLKPGDGERAVSLQQETARVLGALIKALKPKAFSKARTQRTRTKDQRPRTRDQGPRTKD